MKTISSERLLDIFCPIILFGIIYLLSLLPISQPINPLDAAVFVIIGVPFIARGINKTLFEWLLRIYFFIYIIITATVVIMAFGD